jgi:hypothetical protein
LGTENGNDLAAPGESEGRHRTAHKGKDSIMLTFHKPEPVRLKGHAEFNEKWVQQRIIDDTSILGLDDVELVAAEKIQPNAGRLDLLLHDERLNRRYEVELMLGPTNPSHIMRTIEYWDIERRRYPAYDHVAVIVAEDITSRFLNLISLLSGNIPIIAIQLSAFQVDDKIVLHFARVLDHTELRTDDEWELGDTGGGAQVDRAYWQQRVPQAILALCDEVLHIVTDKARAPHSLQYRRKHINIIGENMKRRVWLIPVQSLVRVAAYISNPEKWVTRFEDAGLSASLRRGNVAATVSLAPETFHDHKALLTEFIAEAFAVEEAEAV